MLTARMILDAVHELERRGAEHLLRTLEQVEPELASYAMERLSALHGRLVALGGPPKRTAATLRHAQMTLLVCIGAMRAAHLAEWHQAVAGTAVERLQDPDDSEPVDDGDEATSRADEAKEPPDGGR
jgi:hypothetical protein